MERLVRASLVFPALVPVGFFLWGKPEAVLLALILIGLVFLLHAGAIAISMRR